jgi:hypothetical protein
VSLVQGQRYWLAVLSPLGGGANLRVTSAGGASGVLTQQTALAALPAAWATGAPTTMAHVAAYVQQAPPAITLTGPSDGATVSGSVSLSAVVDDDSPIVSLQFLVDGLPVGAPLVAGPYTSTWDSTGVSTTQPHSVTARSTDALGRSQVSSALNVQVDNGPSIQSVTLNPGLTASSVRITWLTDTLADSQIEFGPTTAYGLATPTDPRPTLSHAMQVTGLAPGLTYHFRVRSRDTNGAVASSPDATFTTAEP